jgi:hypothetical protein
MRKSRHIFTPSPNIKINIGPHYTRANIINVGSYVRRYEDGERARATVDSCLFGFGASLIFCHVEMTPDPSFAAGMNPPTARTRTSYPLDRMYVDTRTRYERAAQWAAADLLVKHHFRHIFGHAPKVFRGLTPFVARGLS